VERDRDMDTHPPGPKVDLLTQTHRFLGSIPTHGFRLADLLNDGNSSILEMQDVLVSTQGVRPTELQAPHLLLRKQDVLAAFLSGDHEAPLRRSNNRVERRRHGAMFMLPGMMLSGIVHLPGRIPSDAFLAANSLLPPFLALTNPTIHSSLFKLRDEPYEVAIIRREWIEAMELSGELARS
jgi:hypothetical protein